jgi:hypothetical protein
MRWSLICPALIARLASGTRAVKERAAAMHVAAVEGEIENSLLVYFATHLISFSARGRRVNCQSVLLRGGLYCTTLSAPIL